MRLATVTFFLSLFLVVSSRAPLWNDAELGDSVALNCSSVSDCSSCATQDGCLWCGSQNQCYSYEIAGRNNCTNLCSGSSCADICTPSCTRGIFPCSETWSGQIILILFYGVLLGGGAKLISDGSELMLELFPKWGTVIGALLLPILGAIPDAAIILVSGAFGSREEAQTQVAVGVGTLAGSTIMLLTVPWAASLILARCDIDDVGETIDGKCTGFSLTRQAVEVDQDTPTNARIMFFTSTFYFIVQGVAFAYLYDATGTKARQLENPFALAGFIFCAVALLGYCVYQVFVPKLAAKRQEKVEKDREARLLKLKALHVVHTLQKFAPKKSVNNGSDLESASLLPEHEDIGNAKALNMGLRWKKKAAASAEEKRQQLVEEIENKEESEEEQEDDPRLHFRKNLIKGLALMIGGTVVIAFFSDPMVDVITDFSATIHVQPFFVSFLLTPYCSNASELISSLVFASGKRRENASLTYSQMYGAATMNNTMGLGIFFALVYFRKLAWAFTAETLAILLVTWILAGIASFKTHFKVYWAIPVIALYPLSLVFVWFLESVVDWA